jgi:hypothetical protein
VTENGLPENFIDQVTDAAFTRVLMTVAGLLPTATEKEVLQSERICKNARALIENREKISQVVRQRITYHQKDTLAGFNIKAMEAVGKIRKGGPTEVELKHELEELLSEAHLRLEKLVEDDIVRIFLGPEGGN